MGAPRAIADRIVRLFEMNGAVGLAVLGRKLEVDEVAADPRLYQARRGAGARLGAERRQPFPGARPVGAAADRRPRPRFRAIAARVPRAAQAATIPRRRSTNGSPTRARASTSSAAPSSAPAPPRSPPPRCSPRSRPRRGCCSGASVATGGLDRRSNSQTRIALPDWAGRARVDPRSASIRARPSALAAAASAVRRLRASASQKTGSRLIESRGPRS